MWSVTCFDTELDFINPTYILEYEQQQLEIVRGDIDSGHLVYHQCQDSELNQSFELVNRFLSELSWIYDTKVEIMTRGAAGLRTKFNKQGKYYRVGNSINLDGYEQEATKDIQKLALGIYREAVSSNSNFYKFLCYARIINITNPSGSMQRNWYNENIGNIEENSKVIERMNSNGVHNIGKHVYQSGRCAIAHASFNNGEVVADADSYNDHSRIANELPLMKEFAQIFMFQLGLRNYKYLRSDWKTRKLRRYLGFPDVMPEKYDINEFQLKSEYNFSVGIENSEYYYHVFKNKRFTVKIIDEQNLLFAIERSNPIVCSFILNLKANRIHFDWEHMELLDKYSRKPCLECLEYHKFLREVIPNGSITVIEPSNGIVLGKTEPIIPVNIDMGRTLDDLDRIIAEIERYLGIDL